MLFQMHKCLKMESPSSLSSKISTVSSLSERKRLSSLNTMNIAKVRANKRFEVATPTFWKISQITSNP